MTSWHHVAARRRRINHRREMRSDRIATLLLTFVLVVACESKPAVSRVDTVEVRDSIEALTVCRKAMPEQGFTKANLRNYGGGHYTIARRRLDRARPDVAVCRTFLGKLDTTYFELIPREQLRTEFERNRDEALEVCRKAMPEQDLRLEDVHDMGGGNFIASRPPDRPRRPTRVCKTRSGKLDTTYIEAGQR